MNPHFWSMKYVCIAYYLLLFIHFFICTCNTLPSWRHGKKKRKRNPNIAIRVFAGGFVISTTIITLMCLACWRYYRITTHKRIGIWGSQVYEHHWRFWTKNTEVLVKLRWVFQKYLRIFLPLAKTKYGICFKIHFPRFSHRTTYSQITSEIGANFQFIRHTETSSHFKIWVGI